MHDFEVFLEQWSKEMYCDDNSPLTELEYDMLYLELCLEDMLRVGNYKHFNEKIEDFSKYKKKYIGILTKILKEFSEVVMKENPNEHFIETINGHIKDLENEYDFRIQFLGDTEAKVVNDFMFSYKTLLRTINAYIKNNCPEIGFINVDEPVCFDSEPENYIQYLMNFANDQKAHKLLEIYK